MCNFCTIHTTYPFSVIETSSAGIVSLSGRADGAATPQSNVGYNVRVTNAQLAEELAESLKPNSLPPPFTADLVELLQGTRTVVS